MPKFLRFSSVDPWTIQEQFKLQPWYAQVAGEERDEIRQKLQDNFMADAFFVATGIVQKTLIA